MNLRLAFILGGLVACSGLIAQPASSPADLSAPSLAVHATLAQNNQAPMPLQEGVARVANLASAKGTPSRDVAATIHDEPVTSGDVQGLYQRLVCRADAVIIGRAIAWAYHLTMSAQAVYADYDVGVDAVLRNNASSPISAAKDIVVTRPGGTVPLGGSAMSYDHEAYPRLQPQHAVPSPPRIRSGERWVPADRGIRHICSERAELEDRAKGRG